MVIDSHRGDIVGMTKEHLSIVLSLKVSNQNRSRFESGLFKIFEKVAKFFKIILSGIVRGPFCGSSASTIQKSFDRGGPVWPPRSNAKDGRSGGGTPPTNVMTGSPPDLKTS